MDLLSLILPKEVLGHFEMTSLEESADQVDIYLEEISVRPEGDEAYISKGFTPYSTVQDYPLRGRTVFACPLLVSLIIADMPFFISTMRQGFVFLPY